MKKLLSLLLLISGLVLISGCNSKPTPTPTPDPIPDPTPSDEIVLTNASFEDTTFKYDGSSKSLVLTGVSTNYTITYENNDKIDCGEYTVTAVITYNGNEKKLTAKMTIIFDSSSITYDNLNASYTGEAIKVVAKNYPSSLKVEYENNNNVEANSYLVKVKFYDKTTNKLQYETTVEQIISAEGTITLPEI